MKRLSFWLIYMAIFIAMVGGMYTAVQHVQKVKRQRYHRLVDLPAASGIALPPQHIAE
jgi:hypothetical protein